MSEELQEELTKAQEKIRLNAIKHLVSLGYKKNTDSLSTDQIEARIEILEEQKKEVPKPKIKGVDGFTANITAMTGKEPEEPEETDPDTYDALQAIISQLAPDSRLNKFEGARVLRVLKPVNLGDGHTVLRRMLP